MKPEEIALLYGPFQLHTRDKKTKKKKKKKSSSKFASIHERLSDRG
jgi:hypothetical protein